VRGLIRSRAANAAAGNAASLQRATRAAHVARVSRAIGAAGVHRATARVSDALHRTDTAGRASSTGCRAGSHGRGPRPVGFRGTGPSWGPSVKRHPVWRRRTVWPPSFLVVSTVVRSASRMGVSGASRDRASVCARAEGPHGLGTGALGGDGRKATIDLSARSCRQGRLRAHRLGTVTPSSDPRGSESAREGAPSRSGCGPRGRAAPEPLGVVDGAVAPEREADAGEAACESDRRHPRAAPGCQRVRPGA